MRKQKDKQLPSGGSPDDFYNYPERHGGEECGIDVDMDVITQLLDDSEEGKKHMCFVDEEFEPLVEEAYEAIGSPAITLHSAWTVFRHLVVALAGNN